MVPSSGSDHRYLRGERRLGLPIVFLDRPPAGLTCDAVLSDNFEGAARAVEHLVRHGHRRIGFLGDVPATLYTRRERYRGYRHALEQAGIDVDPGLVDHGHHEGDAAAATARLLGHGPTAIFAANNLACMGAIIALTRARRRGVALVGFDDFVLADAFEPGTSVVAQDAEHLGNTAAELVFARLDGDRSGARTVVLPTELVARGSGELPPID